MEVTTEAGEEEAITEDTEVADGAQGEDHSSEVEQGQEDSPWAVGEEDHRHPVPEQPPDSEEQDVDRTKEGKKMLESVPRIYFLVIFRNHNPMLI